MFGVGKAQSIEYYLMHFRFDAHSILDFYSKYKEYNLLLNAIIIRCVSFYFGADLNVKQDSIVLRFKYDLRNSL